MNRRDSVKMVKRVIITIIVVALIGSIYYSFK